MKLCSVQSNNKCGFLLHIKSGAGEEKIDLKDKNSTGENLTTLFQCLFTAVNTNTEQKKIPA